MGHLREERRDGIVGLDLDRSVTNPIDPELLAELDEAVTRIADDRDARALVLGSTSDRFFSLGFDIPALHGLFDDDFAGFFRRYNRLTIRLFSLPRPTVAAIPGHTIAGGCILPLACDHRVIAGGRTLMGLNEVKLGVPVPWPGFLLLREIAGPMRARVLAGEGEFFPADDLLAMGLVDDVAPKAEVRERAFGKASALADLPKEAWRATKRDRTEPLVREMRASLEERERVFLELWHSPEARALLEEAMEKF